MIGKYFIPFLETLDSAWCVRSLSWIYRLLWEFDGKASNYLIFSMSYTNSNVYLLCDQTPDQPRIWYNLKP